MGFKYREQSRVRIPQRAEQLFIFSLMIMLYVDSLDSVVNLFKLKTR